MLKYPDQHATNPDADRKGSLIPATSRIGLGGGSGEMKRAAILMAEVTHK